MYTAAITLYCGIIRPDPYIIMLKITIIMRSNKILSSLVVRDLYTAINLLESKRFSNGFCMDINGRRCEELLYIRVTE